ncbi:MAG: MarR family transcriptional regulator [Rhizobiaceae bacterium]|nr:MarR family transcriptional regulator [Rhizobiaceae bacterium]
MEELLEVRYDLDEQIGYLLRLANQRHGLIFQANAIDNITATQFAAMVRISECEECSQNHLGRMAGMDVATIKGVVDRLLHRKFVKSRPDPRDKRRLLVSLTEPGIRLVEKMKEAGKKITADTMQPLSKQEQKTLLKILKKIT